jgi:hypothetical protein
LENENVDTGICFLYPIQERASAYSKNLCLTLNEIQAEE